MEGIDTDRAQRASEIATLRAIAQEHLQEIGQQEEQERREEKEVQAVLAEENQRRTKNRQGSSAPEMDEEIEKGAKLRSAQDVLDRIRWDSTYDASEYVVGYLDRFGGNKEIKVSMWLNESTEEDWIPQHRIRYFKRLTSEGGEEVVWHRMQRIDRIFGSGGGGGCAV